MFRIESEKPLSSECPTRYKGMAYDGCRFYLTINCECRVVQFDSCFHEEKSFDTCRCYRCICYDPKENCFWASNDQCMSTIFKLNNCFHEIDSIHVHCSDDCGGLITGISYSCCDDALLVSFLDGIVHVDKQCPENSRKLMGGHGGWILGVVSVFPYYISYSTSENGKRIRVYSRDGDLIRSMDVPCKLFIESAVFFPCARDCGKCHFYVLISKQNRYPYILDCVMDCDVLCDRISDCNYEICDRECEECEQKDCCSDVLESIALMEASMAGILHAEGNKLQKTISSTDDVCKILAVNNSVNAAIVKATHLEQVLYDKLDALKDCCCFCEDDECDEAAFPLMKE